MHENPKIIKNTIQININNNQNMQYNIPNYSSQQINNTQLTQTNNSQIQVNFIRSNFNYNKKLIDKFRKQNINLYSSERKF